MFWVYLTGAVYFSRGLQGQCGGGGCRGSVGVRHSDNSRVPYLVCTAPSTVQCCVIISARTCVLGENLGYVVRICVPPETHYEYGIITKLVDFYQKQTGFRTIVFVVGRGLPVTWPWW